MTTRKRSNRAWIPDAVLVVACAVLPGCVSAKRTPGDEARIEAVPMPKAVRQADDCGVTALESMCRYWGDPVDSKTLHDDVISEDEPGGTTMRAVLAFLNRRGYDARLQRATFEDLRREVREGRPVLVFLKADPRTIATIRGGLPTFAAPVMRWPGPSNHIVLVTGYHANDRYVLCHSGRETGVAWDHDDFALSWSRASHAAVLVRPLDGNGK